MSRKKRNIRYTGYFFLALCISVWMGACKPSAEIAPDPAAGKAVEVTLSLKVPGKVRPMTYALNQADENAVESIDVLVFDAENQFQYRVRSYAITSSGTDGFEKNVALKMVPGTVQLTVLANASSLLDQVFPTGIATGTDKTIVLSQLILHQTGKWNAQPTDPAYRPIPMWGEMSDVVIEPGTALTGENAIRLIRMLARIDVTLDAGVVDDFTLSSVRLYNYREKGHLIPATGETAWDALNHKALLPTVPTSTLPVTTPLVYGATELTTPGVALSGVLYTFEAAKATPSDLDQAPCLVIGGVYQGGNTTYYRIDFAQTESGTTTFLDLLRNHIYTVTITGVAGAGYATPEEALQARAVNIASEVVEWDDSGLSDIVSDGQYVLGVSTAQLSLPATFVSSHIWVNTTYPAGITATSSASWLVLTQSSLPGGDQRSALSYVATANGTGQTRSAVITLEAGRLKKEITVTQAY